MGPGEGRTNASKQTSFPFPTPALWGELPLWALTAGLGVTILQSDLRENLAWTQPHSAPSPLSRLEHRLGSCSLFSLSVFPDACQTLLYTPCPTSLMSSCDPSWPDTTALSGSNEERQCRLSSRSKTWGCCPLSSSCDWEMLLGRHDQSSLPFPHCQRRQAGI